MTDPSPASNHAAPLQVLVVCARGEHLNTVRNLTSQWPRAAHIEWTADPVEAVQRAQQVRPVLAIVDSRIDRASGCALIHELGRCHAGIDIMAFDDRGTRGLPAHSTWHWPELSRAVTWWVHRHFQLAPATRLS